MLCASAARAQGLTATITYPTDGAVNADLTQAIQWTSVPNVQAYYLYVGTTLGAKDLVNTGEIQTTSYVAGNLPADQTVYARIWAKAGGVWRYSDSTFSAAPLVATLTYPPNGAVNADLTRAMQWTSVPNAQAYYLYIGWTLGAKDLLNTGEIQRTSLLASFLPVGQTVYARLWTKAGGVWRYSDSTFSAAPLMSTLTYPSNGVVNADLSRPIEWMSVPSVQAYYLYVGTTLGARDLVDTGEIPQTWYWAANLPAGQTVYARIWTKIGGVWGYTDSTFSAAPLVATLIHPADGAVNVDPTRAIEWTSVPNKQAYYLYVGTTAGATDLVNTGEIQQTWYFPKNLPSGRTVYARMWTKVGGGWRYRDSTFTVAVRSTPYFATPMAIPGTIEAENFDNGGEGVAYHDDSAGNTGGQYRATDVDIAPNADSTGFVIGWVSAGEWLNYTVTVATAGAYTASFRVASLAEGGTFHLQMNSTVVAGTLTVPDTGGWQNWQTVSTTVTLAAGTQVMRLVMDTAGVYAVGNFDSMRFALAPSATAAPPPPSTVSAVPTTYTAISDRVVRPKPALMPLGPAGYRFSDPTFGSPLLRVTDANTRSSSVGVSYRTPSETWNRAWNATSTRFVLVSTDGTNVPYAFDPATMTAARIPGPGDGGLILAFDAEPEFSVFNPDVIYGRSSWYGHTVVTAYDFATALYSPVADVQSLVPGIDSAGRTYLRSVETGGTTVEYMTFVFGGQSQDLDHYAIWFPVGNLGARKLVDTLASTINGVPTNIPLGFYAHAVAIDQSGRYVVIGATAGAIAAGKAPNYIWDTTTDVFTPMTVSAGGHGALGHGVNVNNPDDRDSTDFVIRDLNTPGTTRYLIAPFPSPLDFSVSSHASWSNAQPYALVPILAALFRYGGDSSPWREWDEEIIALRTDGVESRVWRFAHHRSDYNHNGTGDTDPFWYTPRPNISPDGHWAIFTSNWEKTLGDDTRETNKRQDVFLVKLR